MKKRILALFMALAFGVTLFACTDDDNGGLTVSDVTSDNVPDTNPSLPDDGAPPTPDMPASTVKDGSVSVVVLGDSIARGYGLPDVEKGRFSTLLGDKLEKDYDTVSVTNYGVDGMTGAGLVALLSTNMPAEIADCDYVLISIGGNNVLGSLPSVLGLDGIDPSKNAELVSDYMKYVYAPDEATKKQYEYAPAAIRELIRSVKANAARDEFESLTVSAANDLRNEIPAIMSAIRSKNPDAKIILQTIYNPYNNIVASVPEMTETVDLDEIGERSVSGMNAVIKELASANGYTVAEVCEAFDALSLRPVNANWDLTVQDINYDPHPNAFGHSVIADVYYALINEEN